MPRKSAAVSEKTAKVVKSLPTSESGRGVLCKDRNGQEYTLSHNPLKEKQGFTLWKHIDGGYEKVASANSPPDLYAMIKW